MKKSINEKYFQSVIYRNDIYRKFEKQFKYCFLNPININDTLYVEHATTEYKNAFEIFFNSNNSDVKFFIGYTGVGKTTFTKHYLKYKTLGIISYDSNSIVIPNSWDGKKVSVENYKKEIDEQISNVIDSLIDKLYKPYEDLIIDECDEILEYMKKIRTDTIQSLSIEEICTARNIGCKINQFKLQKIKDKKPVELSCMLLKYVMEKHNETNIKRLIFVVDDLETLSQKKLRYIIESYFKIYACMHNAISEPIVNLLINVRPHSFRFLKQNINHQYINSYGNYLQMESYRLIKNEIPNIKDIFKRRFEEAIKNTPKPGNQTTWDTAKKVFFEIIDDFDDSIIDMISDLCHMNIRAITDCFQMILSNRVWCQEFKTTYSEHPNIDRVDYRFDIVNVLRTLACGENSVYTGSKEIQFNPNNMLNVQSRPSFDDSTVFIPNLLIDVNSKECDVLSLIIIKYLDGFFSSSVSTQPQTEFITRADLCSNIYQIFGKSVTKEKISVTIDYLFENRIIRKSIISKDSDDTINTLENSDHLYLTRKGSRLLSMFESDSVLLEIYREDIKREYENEEYYKSSCELISSNERSLLFDDLINLANEIYISEDNYQKQIKNNNETSSFYDINFPITKKVLSGIKNSLNRSQNFGEKEKRKLNNDINALSANIDKRIKEMRTTHR